MNILHGLVSGKPFSSATPKNPDNDAGAVRRKGLALLLTAMAAAVNGEVRFWASESGSAKLGDGVNWRPAAEVLDAADVLHLNAGTGRVATVSADDSMTVGTLYVGRGMKYDYSAGTEAFSIDFDKGGRLDVAGGTLNVGGELWVGGGYSDKDDDILNVTGGTVSANLMNTGDCDCGSGKRNEINLAGGEIRLTAEGSASRFSTYLWGTTHLKMTGGKFTSWSPLRFGDSGVADVEIDGGEFTAHCAETEIGCGDRQDGKHVSRVRIGGGTWNSRSVHVGRDDGEGLLEIVGGTTVISNGEWYGACTMGWHPNSRGTVRLDGNANVAVHGTLVSGFEGSGLLEIAGGTMSVVGNTTLGNKPGARGVLHVKGGRIAAGQDVYVGFVGSGRLTIDGGALTCDSWLSFNRDSANVVTDSRLEFNGGEIVAAKIIAEGSAESRATIDWNGGVFKPNRNYSGGDPIIVGNGRMAISVRPGGAIVDTDDLDRTISAPMSGDGFLEKRGSGRLTLADSNSIRGGFRVIAGTLGFAEGCGPDTSAVYREILIEEGATLDLGGATVTANRFVNRGAIVNGSVTVDPLLGAVWTGAAGDGDAANPANWEVRTESGSVFEMENPFDDPEVKFIVDGMVKLPNKAEAPEIVKSAAGWYDPSDASTIALNEAGGVVSIRNKGTKGAALDLAPIHDAGPLPGYGDAWRLNGLRSFACTNTWGFMSKEAAGLANGQDRTIVTLAKQERNKYPYVENGAITGYEQQMFPFGLESAMWDPEAGRFRIEMWGDRCKCVAPGDFDAETGKCREMIAYESFGEFPEWMNWNMGTSNGYVRVDAYPESGAEIHAAPEVASSLMSSADQRVILGQRLLYDSRSAGMLAESIFFDRALTWEELTEVNAYLQRKWMEPFPEFPLNFRLRTGGTLDLNGLEIEVASLSGGGTVVNGGNASVATLEAEVNADGAVDAPVIEGDFDLAKLGTVALSGTANLSTTRPATLLTATGVLAGDSAAVQIESDATPNRKIKLFKEGNSLKVLLRGGMMVIIR